MNIIGLHDGHNASVALVQDGELRYALQEERITREKNASGFPSNALEYTLEQNNLGISDIDVFAVANNHLLLKGFESIRELMKKRQEKQGGNFERIKQLLRNTWAYDVHKKRLHSKKNNKLIEFGIPEEKIKRIEHHTNHAASSYFSSPFSREEEVLIFTCDGGGDKLCATVSRGENNNIERLESIPDDHSLGTIYATITFLMGMVPGEHEYKIMGLAPYVMEEKYEDLLDEFRSLLTLDSKEDRVWSRGKGVPSTLSIRPHLEDLLKYERFDRVAGAIQSFVEEILVDWVQNNVRHYDIHKVVLGGGVFMNVKANQQIRLIPEVQSLFPMPSCGDTTNSIGAAYAYLSENEEPLERNSLKNMYLGPSFTSKTVRESLDKTGRGCRWEKKEDIEESVAELLAKGEIVARYKGRMEFGARALGHRSILARPDKPDNVDIINDMIKKRDFWMPFAGTILKEDAKKYINDYDGIDAPYMIITFDSTPEAREEIQCTLHPKDATTRPQIINKKTDRDYFRLLKIFKEKTGIGSLLNTSFNLHGYPIVCHPDEAIEVLKKSGLKYLALEDYLVQTTDE